jgi:hypothetical protein
MTSSKSAAMAGPPSSRSSLPSVPGEPRVRRLGVGSSSSGDRPLRAQVVVALVCTAMLIAVPLYLWRKPGTRAAGALASASASASAGSGPEALPKTPAQNAGAPAAAPRLSLGTVQKVRCGSSAAAAPNEGTLCDTLGPFEEALKKAIVTGEDCAPKSKLKGSINYVLTVDFAHKRLHVFPGASGDWRGKQARRSTSCIQNGVKITDWNVPHQYRFYAIAVLATYAGPPGSEVVTPATSGNPAQPSMPAQPTGPTLPSFE